MTPLLLSHLTEMRRLQRIKDGKVSILSYKEKERLKYLENKLDDILKTEVIKTGQQADLFR